jgi:hypothetical protein
MVIWNERVKLLANSVNAIGLAYIGLGVISALLEGGAGWLNLLWGTVGVAFTGLLTTFYAICAKGGQLMQLTYEIPLIGLALLAVFLVGFRLYFGPPPVGRITDNRADRRDQATRPNGEASRAGSIGRSCNSGAARRNSYGGEPHAARLRTKISALETRSRRPFARRAQAAMSRGTECGGRRGSALVSAAPAARLAIDPCQGATRAAAGECRHWASPPERIGCFVQVASRSRPR